MRIKLLRLIELNAIKNIPRRRLHTSNKLERFYELDRKGGGKLISDYKEEPKNIYQQMKSGYKYLIEETKIWKDEWKEHFFGEIPLIKLRNEVDVVWKFTGDPEQLSQWVVSSDSDFEDGRSTSKLEFTPEGKGVFHGVLDTKPIKDGQRSLTGYCNLRTVQLRRSFYRKKILDWTFATHIVLRIRGDGRNYMLNLHPFNTFDIMWMDLHSFVLHTRGGPYWQYVRIPFSKFLLSNRGRIQDLQGRVVLGNLKCISITVADAISGPFRLEIDYVGTEYDTVAYEEFAYELYQAPHPFYN